MQLTDKIYIAGHSGLVGSALKRLLQKKGYNNLLTRSSADLDLRDQLAVRNFFQEHNPQYVFLAAAKVGGILANNTYPADFIFDNIYIQSNIIHAAYLNGVEKLMFLGSSCIYPKHAPQPIREEYLMTGPLEPTNAPYAMAKLAGLEMCKSFQRQFGSRFISVMPTNLYGPGDNYHLQHAHVMPALMRKFHEATLNNNPTVTIWGSGKPRREFLHVDDAAMACYFLMQKYESPEIVNIGSGIDYSIQDLAEMLQQITGFQGRLDFDKSKPDGTMRKLLDVSKINTLGWTASISLKEGLENTYEEFRKNYLYYINNKEMRYHEMPGVGKNMLRV